MPVDAPDAQGAGFSSLQKKQDELTAVKGGRDNRPKQVEKVRVFYSSISFRKKMVTIG